MGSFAVAAPDWSYRLFLVPSDAVTWLNLGLFIFTSLFIVDDK